MIHILSNLAIITICNAIAVFLWIHFDQLAERYDNKD